ncbi:hypothetical protein HFP57_07585 [Parasphingopyxis algicola]|uniref:hypothetical protein n=1 Tax=Parasphingopyxis algicola TaxID=2026624 RepID=UPI0015A10D58|nr:hypothetical protein [Parasphingopyxis algicola]QLC24904.1 hypothetical protein HFP57_07585 [Parasphingopyxis algicola]
MKTGSGHSLLAASALLALAACGNPEENETPDVSVDEAESDGAMIEEPAGDEIDPEALPPDYPPTPSVDPAEDAGDTTMPEDSMGTEDRAPEADAAPDPDSPES